MASKALVRPAQLDDIENLLRLAPITRASNRQNSRPTGRQTLCAMLF
ncbi:MAG TPA: hypothetical protein VKB48_12350 [Candidatus Acidoferrum sp.]|nr:hypothetical protein [Candidatus Acidoferrum sp.]